MNLEATVADQADAQRIFETLPERLQLPSLSPTYVAADARRDPALVPRFLVWRRGPRLLMHAVHEAAVPGRHHSDWQSAYGYGGPLAAGLDDDDRAAAWHALDSIARERRIVAEFVRFHPLLHNERDYPGEVRADRSAVKLDLVASDLLGRYSGRARTAVRKALHDGLALRWETAADAKAAFPGFYRDGMRQIGASDFYLFADEYFDALLDMPAARVLSVTRDGTRLAMGVFLFGPEVAEYHLSAASPEGRRLNATNLLLHGAAESAREAGLRSLYLGGGTTPAADNPLLWFKTSYAPADLTFSIGWRIHDPAAYAELQAEQPDLARASRRILFYRN
jgi:hypothetical protein